MCNIYYRRRSLNLQIGSNIEEVGVLLCTVWLCDLLLAYVPNFRLLVSMFFQISQKKHVNYEENPNYGQN